MVSVGTAHSVRPPGASDTSVSSLRVRLLSNSGWSPYCGGRSREHPVTNMAMEAEVRPSTGCDIYQWLREVCSTKLLATVVRLGGAGVGVIVQIDESLFRHKPKVKLSSL